MLSNGSFSELDEMREQMRSIQNQSLRDKDELQQIKTLYKVKFNRVLSQLKFKFKTLMRLKELQISYVEVYQIK